MKSEFDLVVVGGGPAGYSSAIRGITKGWRVCLIEQEKLGGTCLNWGCFPTKCLIRDAQLFSDINHAEFVEGEFRLIFEKVVDRKDHVILDLVHGIQTVLLNRGVEIIEGKGMILNSKKIRIAEKDGTDVIVTGRKIVIATGSDLISAPFQNGGEKILSSRDALTLKTLPKNLLIVGGGRRGIEFATIFRGFGCEVTVLEKKDRILPKEDAEISQRLRRILTMQGIKVMLNAEAVEAKISDSGSVNVTLESRKGVNQIEAENMLVLGQRVGNTEGLGLEKLGMVLENGFVQVNDTFETSVPDIYAVGDVNGRGFLAHKSLAEGIFAVDHMSGTGIPFNFRLIPRCTYTSPEVASIGLTQEEAEETGDEIEVGKFPVGASGRALTLGQDQGIIKIISGKRYGGILGFHMLAPQATELIAVASLAMRNELGVEEVKAAIYGHPTMSEAIFEAALDVRGEAIHFIKGN